MKTPATLFRAATPFGTFERRSSRAYRFIVAREDGWHRFSESEAAALAELRYQRNRGRNVAIVNLEGAQACAPHAFEYSPANLEFVCGKCGATKEAGR